MQADKITIGAHFGNTAHLLRFHITHITDRRAVVKAYLHAKPKISPPGNRLANPAHPNNAKPFIGHRSADQMGRPPATPLTSAELTLALTGTAAEH